MRYLAKAIGLAALAALALMGPGAGSASATILEVGGTLKHESVEITASLKSGTSAYLKNTEGTTANTCLVSHAKGKTETDFDAPVLTGKLSSLSFETCSNPVTVHAPGKLEITHIAGTTNGTVSSEEAQVTVGSLLGTLNCLTGATNHLGTLTGVSSGEATLHINAIINCGIIPSAKWEATYTVTSPEGVGVTTIGPMLEVEGEPSFESVELATSLKSGASQFVKDTAGFSRNTCTTSQFEGATNAGAASAVTAPLSTVTFGSCTRPVTVHKPGKLKIEHIAGTTNGTVSWEEAQVTVGSPIGTLNCDTGKGTDIGTLTGVASGETTIDVNAVIDCGIIPSAKWEATYTVTSPSGLGVTRNGPALEIGGDPKSESVAIEASLKGGASLSVKTTAGTSHNTCTTSQFEGSTNAGAVSAVTAPLSTVTFGSCTRPVTVHKPGKLKIEHIPGTTNGTVSWEEAQVTVGSPIGTLSCDTGESAHIGTLTGVSSGEATIDVNAVINCGINPSAKWEATYTVTSPSGMGVTTA